MGLEWQVGGVVNGGEGKNRGRFEEPAPTGEEMDSRPCLHGGRLFAGKTEGAVDERE